MLTSVALITLYYGVEQIKKFDMESVYSRQGEELKER